MKPEYIIFRYSCEHKTLSKHQHHVSPFLILTRKELVRKTLSFPQKRLTKRRIKLFRTANESICISFCGVLEIESVNERFQKLCKVLREYTNPDDFEIIYYHEF